MIMRFSWPSLESPAQISMEKIFGSSLPELHEEKKGVKDAKEAAMEIPAEDLPLVGATFAREVTKQKTAQNQMVKLARVICAVAEAIV